MSSADYGNNLLDAIELIVDDKVSNAKFNKTIQAVIIEKTDANLGKYKAKYQDSEIDVYSSNPDTTYSTGSLVYVTVPNGDFKQDKVILSAVQKENVEREIVLEQEDEYKVSGGNVVNSTQTYGLCSYKENSKTILYDRDRSVNDINLNVIGLKENVKTNPYLIIAAEFRTELDKGQQSQGNYGIVYDIDFKDNATGKTVTKSYILDIDKMKGTPYDLASFVRQYGIFKIDNENFISVKQVYLFAKDFPLTEEGHSNDIFAQNFELSVADKIKDLSAENYDLSLTKSGKGYFDVKDSDFATINITAKLTFKNKETTQGIEYYWFIEDNTVDTTSTDYLSYGGKGWACVNNYNIVDGSASQKMFIASNNYKTVVKAEVPTSRKAIKCVCVKNGMILAKGYCEIYNYDADYNLEIISDSGTKFYYDNGTPTLTCLVDGEESNSYTYKWSYTDNNDTTILLEETTQDNETYNNNLHAYEALLTKIERGIVMPAASQEELDEYKTIIDSFDDIQRVEGNKVINIDLSKVMDYGTFKCSIYDTNDNLVGTAAILITNEFTIEGNYDLIINSGLQTYIYNRMGVAPTSDSLDNPIKLQPLTFTIVDSKGNALGQKILEQCEIEWTPPKNNSLIEVGIEQSLNELTLLYSIAEKYNKTKAENNKIGLSVKYKDLNLSTETAFTFVKEGDPGVNGNDVVCKIVPNLSDEDLKAFKEYPMIMNGTLNYTPAELGGKWFRVQIWESGIKVWDKSTGDSDVNLIWSILKNTYDSTHSDSSSISVTNGAFNYDGYQEFGADIVKASVTYRNKNYYCNIPVIVGERTDNDYEIKLKKDTGFNTVQYASDGTSPQYDNINPFTIQVLRMINGYQEDVSDTPSAIYKVSYDWGVRGRWYKDYGNDTGWEPVNYLINIVDSELAGNQKIYKPIDKYDGKVVNNALEVKILNANNIEIGKLHIPIYFFLNKEGIDSIKGWDGNSISLNEQYGSILAPQVGAGEKDSNNRFTGMLMGKVKEVGKEEEEGLFGYVSGERSIFLNAKTGDASFGKQGEGQIVISPSTGGKIYGGNYNQQAVTGTGMMIDLSSNPEIKWGNGKFSVNSNGILTCTDAVINGNLVNDKGLYTSIIYTGIGYNAWFAGTIGFAPMGTSYSYDYGTSTYTTWQNPIWIDIVIPDNFTVNTVVVHVYHCQMSWYDEGYYNATNIQLYISGKDPYMRWHIAAGGAGPGDPSQDGTNYTRIGNGVFNGSNEWYPNGCTQITTQNISSYCHEPGRYRLKLQSGDIRGEYQTGAVYALAEISGWKKL